MTNPAVASKAKPPASHTHSEQASVFETFVPALTARGHGLQALCFFFSAAAELVLSSIVRIAPSDRPYRICYHDKAWTAEQIQQLMTCWPTGAYATVIGQRIGRSASSVRYKAKWLGLPGRPRSSLRREISEASLLPLMPADAITAIENDPADTECAAAALSAAPDDVAPAAEQTAQRLADAAVRLSAVGRVAPPRFPQKHGSVGAKRLAVCMIHRRGHLL